MKRVIATIAVGVLYTTPPVFADNQSEFCIGFSEGYQSIKGDMVIVPICPIAPITPIGSTPFRKGIKAGMAAAYDG